MHANKHCSTHTLCIQIDARCALHHLENAAARRLALHMRNGTCMTSKRNAALTATVEARSHR